MKSRSLKSGASVRLRTQQQQQSPSLRKEDEQGH